MSPARPGVTAQCPGHTFAPAGPPHAPCRPQSRADTAQNPLRPLRAAAALRCRRPSFPGRGRFRGPLAPQTASPAAASPQRKPGLEPRRKDVQAPGQGGSETKGREGGGARGPGCGIRRAGELPPRRGEAGGAARLRISLAPAAGNGLRTGAPRDLLTWSPPPAARLLGRRGARARVGERPGGRASCAPFE